MDVNLDTIIAFLDKLFGGIPSLRTRRARRSAGLLAALIFIAYGTGIILSLAWLSALATVCAAVLVWVTRRKEQKKPDFSLLLGASPIGFAQWDKIKGGWGRQPEIEKLIKWVTEGNVAAILLWGPPAVGKTSLVSAGLQSELAKRFADFKYIEVDASDHSDEVLAARLREAGAGLRATTVSAIIKSDRNAKQLVVLDNASAARGRGLADLMEVIQVAIGDRKPYRRVFLVILNEAEYRAHWERHPWKPWSKPDSLKRLFLKPLKKADAIEVARNLKEQASIPVEDEVLEQMAGDISEGAPPRVSALALSTLLRLIADEASSGEELTLEDYKDQGGAPGLMGSVLLDQFDLAAPRYSRDILKIIEDRNSRSSVIARSDFDGLPANAEPEVAAALEVLSSYDQRILTFNSENGKYSVNQEWKPAVSVASTGRAPEVIAEELSLKAKYAAWESQRSGKGRYGRGRLLLTRGDLGRLKRLSAQLSLSGGLRAYIRLSREYRSGQLILALLCVTLLIPVGAASVRAVRGWGEVNKENGSGIPTDFATAGKGLKHLSLLSGCLVTNLAWLPHGLEELDAVCPRVKSLEGAPPNLKKLNVSSSSIASLQGLPRTVTDLDVSSTRLGEDALALRGFPVVHLNAAGIRITSLSKLSRSLESLVLSHPDISSLDGLPDGLSSLDLLGTNVRSLRGLPLGLVTLRVKNNGWETVDYLPPQLDSLDTDRTLREGVRFPDSLRSLTLRSRFFASLPQGLSSLEISDRASLGSALPRGLKRLWVNSSEPSADLNELPPGLQALKLVWPPGTARFDSLPPGLGSLDLTWSNELPDLAGLRPVLAFLNLTKTPVGDFRKVPGSVTELIDRFCGMSVAKEFPERLRSLDLSGCTNLSLVYNLPATLEMLNLSGTAIAKLPPLPENLAQLDISNTKIGGDLPDLPKKLVKLTIHFGQFDSIKRLPKSVRWLVFVPNVDEAQAEGARQ
jgi:Leucine-rich repeat (LRR) protein